MKKTRGISRQGYIVLDELKKGRSLTPMEAIHEFGITRLASCVHELRVNGIGVNAELVKGDGNRFARYTLA